MKATRLRRVLIPALGATLLLVGLPGTGGATTPTCRGDRATLVGGSGPDNLRGTPGPDVIVGRGGHDVIVGAGRGDKICGGRGNDHLFGNRGSDWLIGGPGNDRIRGDRGEDRLDGGAGNDYFNIGLDPDRDVVDGGDGLDDTIDASFPSRDGDPEGGTEPAHIDLSLGTATTERGDTDDLVLYSIESVYGSGIGDTIIGDDRANELSSGYNGGGRIEGGGGDDVLSEGQDGGTEFYGGPGNDVIDSIGERGNIADGGEGTDTFRVDQGVALTADLDAGTASVEGESTSSTLISIENLTGGGGDDRLSGDEGPNVLDGGRFGDDILEGRAGDDTLIGGSGTDDGDGGEGTDICIEIENAVSCEAMN